MKNTGGKAIPQRDSHGRFTGGNPGNSGGKKGRSGRPSADFRGWALTLRDKRVRKVVEEILKDQKHRDRFRAIEFVAKYANEAETTLTGEQVMDLARQLVEVIFRHVPEAERREAIQAELLALETRLQ